MKNPVLLVVLLVAGCAPMTREAELAARGALLASASAAARPRWEQAAP